MHEMRLEYPNTLASITESDEFLLTAVRTATGSELIGYFLLPAIHQRTAQCAGLNLPCGA
jgi:hypothetical protein